MARYYEVGSAFADLWPQGGDPVDVYEYGVWVENWRIRDAEYVWRNRDRQ